MCDLNDLALQEQEEEYRQEAKIEILKEILEEQFNGTKEDIINYIECSIKELEKFS